MEVLADEELVGLDDGGETGQITIHLSAVCLHEQLVFRCVKQKLRLQCLHELFPRRELGFKKSSGCLYHCMDRNSVL